MSSTRILSTPTPRPCFPPFRCQTPRSAASASASCWRAIFPPHAPAQGLPVPHPLPLRHRQVQGGRAGVQGSTRLGTGLRAICWGKRGSGTVVFCRRRGQAPALRDGRFRSPSRRRGYRAAGAYPGELVPLEGAALERSDTFPAGNVRAFTGPRAICWGKRSPGISGFTAAGVSRRRRVQGNWFPWKARL